MESRSSESRGFGYSSYGSLRESRSSESRISYPSYSGVGGMALESRGSESHDYLSSSGESRIGGESHQIQGAERPQYNSLEDIDKLIEKLEGKEPQNVTGFSRLQKAWDKRSKKLAELKKLREEVSRYIEEEKSVQSVEEENKQIDKAIDGIKKLIKKREVKPPVSQPKSSGLQTHSSYSYYDSSESRDSGESRW